MPSLLTQTAYIVTSLGSSPARADALYVVAGGGNNARAALAAIAGGADPTTTTMATASQFATDMRKLRLRRRPHPAAQSRIKRQNPLPPFRLQRVLRNVRQLPKLARRRMPAQKTARRGHGWPGGRKVAGTGTEQTRFHSGNRRVVSKCDAECDAYSTDRVEVLARAVVLVAGMNIPEAAREAVLARVVAGLTSPTMQIPE